MNSDRLTSISSPELVSPATTDSHTTRHALSAAPLFILLLFTAWSVFVLSHYYIQLWRLVWNGGWPQPYFPGDPRLPYFGEAARRALVGVSAASLLLLASTGLGFWIVRRLGWEPENLREALPVGASVGIGVFSYLGLVLAQAELYRPRVLITTAGLSAALVLLLALHTARSWLRLLRDEGLLAGLPAGLHPLKLMLTVLSPRFIFSRPLFSRRHIWQFITFLAVLMAFIAALAPEREYDALWYHLGYPRLYLEHGRLVDNPVDYVSLYPMTWELWFGYGLALGGQTAATLLHFSTLPLTALVVYELARRFVPGAPPWLAAALFVTIPTVLWEASTAYIDLALALHVSLVVYSLLRCLETSPGSARTGWLLAAAVNLGLALSTKHLALVVLALAVGGLLIRLRIKSGSWKQALGPAFLLGFLALLPALPWYWRSYAASGNPFFPELFSLFGAPPERWDAITQAGLDSFLNSFGRERTFLNLLSLPWHMTVHGAAYHGSLGPAFLIFLPILGLGRLRRETPWMLFFTAFYIAAWASPLASFQMRFLVPVAPLLAVLGAAAMGRLAAYGRLIRLGLARRYTTRERDDPGSYKLPIYYFNKLALTAVPMGLAAVLLLLNLPPFTALHEVDRVEWDGWLNSVLHGVEWGVVIGAESQDAYLSRQVRSYPVWQYANGLLPPGAYVLTWTGGDQFYSNLRRLWIYSAAARPLARNDFKDPLELLPWLASTGITHLIPDVEFRQRIQAAGGESAEGPYEVLFEDRYYSLYRVIYEAQP